jgi:phosphoadenosine phosphosulfate reductase
MLNQDKKVNLIKSSSMDFDELDTKNAKDILSWSLEKFSPRIAFASSFGAEDVVVIDLMIKINKNNSRIFT